MAEERYLRQYEKSDTGNYLLKSRGTLENIIDWSAAKTLTQEESGSLIVAGDATAGVLTLPAAKKGLVFDIWISVAQTGDTHINIPSGYFIGSLKLIEYGTATENVHAFASDGNSNDWINLDDDTKGRLAGGKFRLVCDGTNWLVEGELNGSGTLATPFADAES